MADKKISALPAASTPLAGTEVLPIVQGGSTVKVAVSDLTAGRAVSASSLTASTDNVIIATTAKGITTGSAIPLGLGVNNTVTAITIDTSSNVGIGTVSPSEKLDVVGKIKLSDNLVIGTAAKGIVNSTGTTLLQFTAFQIVSNKQIVAPSVITATGNTASTPTATPVTLFTPSGDGVWIVNALVALTGSPAAYIASSMIKASGGVLAATAISTATNMSISVSGANVQATQTSGGNQVIAFTYIRLF